jgi:hypothetical protein
VDGQDNVDNRVQPREQALDDVTDIEGEEVKAREEAAEGQTTTSQQTHGNVLRPSKQREMKKCGGTLGTGGEWAESEHTSPEDETYKEATPSSPKRTKKLKVEKGRSRLRRDGEAGQGIPSPRPCDHENPTPRLCLVNDRHLQSGHSQH